MIVVDTTILVYAMGEGHPLVDPCRRLVAGIGEGLLDATTTPEVIQEFAHVRSRRRTRQDAVGHARAYADLFSPLVPVGEDDLDRGLRLFERTPGVGSFDGVLAAVAIRIGADALASADRAFARIRGLRWAYPAGPELAQLLEKRT